MLSRAVYGPLDRVRRVSRVMQGMIAIGAAVLLLVLLWAWLGPMGVIEKDLAGVGRVKVEALMRLPFPAPAMTDQTQRIATIVQTLPLVLALYALYQAYQLFAGYRGGEVLTIRAASRLRHISYAMLAVAVTVPLLGAALSVALTWNSSSGQWHLHVPLEAGDYFTAALAGLLLAIAHVLTEAAKIARENSEIV
jgi:Protein of unknown function (DUF2975)